MSQDSKVELGITRCFMVGKPAHCPSGHWLVSLAMCVLFFPQAVLLPPPRPLCSGNYARCVNQVLRGSATSSTQLWLRIPALAPELEAAEDSRQEEDAAAVSDLHCSKNEDAWAVRACLGLALRG